MAGILFKMFKTGASHIVSQCKELFNFPDVPELIFRGKTKFSNRYAITDNVLCNIVEFKFETVD